MHLIVGLGNPGKEYAETRHNVGFGVIDILSREVGPLDRVTPTSVWRDLSLDGSKVVLAKPQTYVNRSGQAVAELLNKFDICPADLIVVHDDLDLPLGGLRVRWNGGSGGHRGVESIVLRINTVDFLRVRIGIGRPPGRKSASRFVLEAFDDKEKAEVELTVAEAADAARVAVKDGASAAMNLYNKLVE